jgi:hypothetical protein
VVLASLEDTFVSINESDGQFMACVTKNLATIREITLEIFDVDIGSAQRIIGIANL